MNLFAFQNSEIIETITNRYMYQYKCFESSYFVELDCIVTPGSVQLNERCNYKIYTKHPKYRVDFSVFNASSSVTDLSIYNGDSQVNLYNYPFNPNVTIKRNGFDSILCFTNPILRHLAFPNSPSEKDQAARATFPWLPSCVLRPGEYKAEDDPITGNFCLAKIDDSDRIWFEPVGVALRLSRRKMSYPSPNERRESISIEYSNSSTLIPSRILVDIDQPGNRLPNEPAPHRHLEYKVVQFLPGDPGDDKFFLTVPSGTEVFDVDTKLSFAASGNEVEPFGHLKFDPPKRTEHHGPILTAAFAVLALGSFVLRAWLARFSQSNP